MKARPPGTQPAGRPRCASSTAFTASGPLEPLSLRFERERLWYEFLRAGFRAADLKQVVSYLQKEIRAQRRNVGALKLSNLLQLDRFEEDLHISRVRLKGLVQRPEPVPPPSPSPAIDEARRTRLLEQLRTFRQQLRRG